MENNSTIPNPYSNVGPMAPTTPTPSNVKEVNSKFNFLKSKILIFIGIITVLILLSGAYLLGKNNSAKPIVKNEITSPSPTPNSIADWKTYEGDDFSFKYPKEYFIDDNSNELSLVINSKDQFGKPLIVSKVIFRTNPELFVKGEKLRKCSNPNSQPTPNCLSDDGAYGQKAPIEKIIIDHVAGINFYIGRGTSDYGNRIVQTTNPAIELLADATDDNFNQIFDQILSTFKFKDANSQTANNYLNIPEYGVKIALSENIKDAYYFPETAAKGYIYLKVHSLDSEPQCKKDISSTAAISRLGKNDQVPYEMTYEEFTTQRATGVTIGDYFYYIDLAQYSCAETKVGQALLEKVRKEFSEAAKTIEKL